MKEVACSPGESHGPLFANTKSLRRYVQHLTLPGAYGVDPAPTYDGVSMFWYDEYEPFDVATDDPEILSLLEAVLGVSSAPPEDAPDLAELPPDVTALFHEVLKERLMGKRFWVEFAVAVLLVSSTSVTVTVTA